MSVVELIRDKVQTLPADRQQEVLNFVEALQQKEAARQPRQGLKGICAGIGPVPTAADIDDARREMWGNFPREDVVP